MPANPNATSASTGTLPEYFLNNRFWVEIDNSLHAYFTQCSGLTAQTQFEEYREGGLNTYTHKLPTHTSYSNITLKRGYGESVQLWTWYEKTAKGTPERKNISLILYSSEQGHQESRRWNLTNAYPIKWSGPEFDANAGSVPIESIELAYEYFTLVTS